MNAPLKEKNRWGWVLKMWWFKQVEEILCLLLNSGRVLTLISKHNFPFTIGIISLPLLCLLIYICLVHEILPQLYHKVKPMGGYIPKMQCWTPLVLGSLFWDAPILRIYPIYIKHWIFFPCVYFCPSHAPRNSIL
jgi:hypothetical protein